MSDGRLTPERLAALRRTESACPRDHLLDEVEASWAERDRLAIACREALRRLSATSELVIGLDGQTLDVAMVRGGLRHALDTLAPEGGG